MKAQPRREEFEALQARYRETWETISALRRRLEAKYSSTHYASQGERARLEALRKRNAKQGERILAWLERYSPRDWSRAVPYWWICMALSFDDAVTSGELTVAPPPAYGYLQVPNLLRQAV
jgi:hypothetical protein